MVYLICLLPRFNQLPAGVTMHENLLKLVHYCRNFRTTLDLIVEISYYLRLKLTTLKKKLKVTEYQVKDTS